MTLIVFSVTFQLPGMNSAFNASEINGRNRRHLNPFKSFWCKRSTYCDAGKEISFNSIEKKKNSVYRLLGLIDGTGDNTIIIIDPKEGRLRLSNPLELSNEIEDDLGIRHFFVVPT